MYVYFIADGDMCKIGKSVAPEDRLLEFQTGNPRELRIIFYIDAVTASHALKIEHALHRYFSHCHHRGEWFKMNPLEHVHDIITVAHKQKFDIKLVLKEEERIEKEKRDLKSVGCDPRCLNL